MQLIELRWSSSCDVGAIHYSNGFFNQLFIDADLCEVTRKIDEENQSDGNNSPVPTFRKYTKSYTINIPFCPEYFADAIAAIQLHDNITIKLYGDNFFYTVKEWKSETKTEPNGYAESVSFSFRIDELITVGACCN